MPLRRLLYSFAVLLSLLASGISAANVNASESSLALIEHAYDRGELTEQEKILYSVQAIKVPEALPTAFQSDIIDVDRCATTYLVEAHQQWGALDGNTQAKLSPLLARPVRAFSIVSPGGFFRIHYDQVGADAVPASDIDPANGIPDFVEWIAEYADSSYSLEVDGLSQFSPPSDGGLGGDNLYDIYTEEMPFYGYAQPEGPGPEPWNDSYSYISVHRNFLGFPPNTDPEGNQKGAAKVTLAHELYHAIQFAYDVGENLWFMEATATWMEDVVYDIVNDNYNYLTTIFDNPEWPLHATTSGHAYSAFIWGKFLDENFGVQTVPDIWNELITTSPYPAFDIVLGVKGTTTAAEVAKFRTWNYITSVRDDGNHFEEAENYLLVDVTRTHSSYPVSGQGPLTGEFPDGMGANYVICNIPLDAFSFTVDFDGQDGVDWIVNLLAREVVTNTYSEYQMSLDGSQQGQFTLSPVNGADELVMVIVNVSQGLDNRTYTYGADYVSSPNYAVDVESMSDDSVYSNSAVTVSFSVENIGLQADNFDIAVTDELGWPMSPTSGGLFLTSGEVGSFDVQVTAPQSEFIGTTNAISLSAEAVSVVGVLDSDSSMVEVFLQHGDSDQSGALTISDAVYLINYVFAGGPAPIPVMLAGDANCDLGISIADAVAIINYIFAAGPYPPCNPLWD